MQVALLSEIRRPSFRGTQTPTRTPLDIFQRSSPPERPFTRTAALACAGGAAGLGAGMLVKYAGSVMNGAALGATAGIMLPLAGAMVHFLTNSDSEIRWDQLPALSVPLGAAAGAGLGLVGKLAPLAGTSTAVTVGLTLAGLGAGVVAARRY